MLDPRLRIIPASGLVAGAALGMAGSFVPSVSLIFGAGVALWAASLMLVSSCRLMPAWIRVVGVIAALLFAVVALQIFMGHPLTAQSEPLPAFAYPVFCVALSGWAWQHYRGDAVIRSSRAHQ